MAVLVICAGCENEIPDGGAVCPACNEPEPYVVRDDVRRDLAAAVRRLKGLVLISFVFGVLVAPFAVVAASNALRRYPADAAGMKEVIKLRRIAIALLIFWAFMVGARVAWLMRM